MSIIDGLRDRQTGLDTEELSELINLHEVTLRDWTRALRIPAYRVGREFRYDPEKIADWLEQREIA